MLTLLALFVQLGGSVTLSGNVVVGSPNWSASCPATVWDDIPYTPFEAILADAEDGGGCLVSSVSSNHLDLSALP